MISQTGTTANRDPRRFLLEMNSPCPNDDKVVPRLKTPPLPPPNQSDYNDTHTPSQRKNLKKPPPPAPGNRQRKNLKKPPPPPTVQKKLPPPPLSLSGSDDQPSEYTPTATITDDDTKSLSDSISSFLDKHHDSCVRTDGNSIVDLSDMSISMGQRRRDLTQHSSVTRIMNGGRIPDILMDDGSLSVHHLFVEEEQDAAGYGHSSLRRGAESNSSRREQPHLHMSYSEGLGPSYSGAAPRRHNSNPGARRFYSHERAEQQCRPPSLRRSFRHGQKPKECPRRHHEEMSDRDGHQEPRHYDEQGGSMYDSRDTRGYYHGPYYEQEQRLGNRSRFGNQGGYEMAKSESNLNYSGRYVQDSRHSRVRSADYCISEQEYDELRYYRSGRMPSSYHQDPYFSQGDGRARGYCDERPREVARRHHDGGAFAGTDQRNHRSMSEMVPRQEAFRGGSPLRALHRYIPDNVADFSSSTPRTQSHAPNDRNIWRSAGHNESATKSAVRPGAFPVVGRGKLEIPQSCLQRASFVEDEDDSRRRRDSDEKIASKSIVHKGGGKDDIYVEVAPGVKEKLRLVLETKNAIKANFYTQAVCWGCCAGLYCVSDASFLICPNCTVISPLEDSVSGSYGVGIAFTKEALNEALAS